MIVAAKVKTWLAEIITVMRKALGKDRTANYF
jgi:hypothetical protein